MTAAPHPTSTQTVAPTPVDTGRVQRFDAAHLELRPGTRMLLEPVGWGRKYWCECVGVKRGRFLLVQPPATLEAREALKEEETTTVRFVNPDYNVCGFTTHIAHVIHKPMSLLFLRFPEHFEVLNMRRHDRAHSLIPVTISHAGQEAKGFIANISRGGCKIVLKTSESSPPPPIEVGGGIFCSFALLGEGHDIHASGTVRGVGTHGERVSIGVEFQDLSEDMGEHIERFVLEIKDSLSV